MLWEIRKGDLGMLISDRPVKGHRNARTDGEARIRDRLMPPRRTNWFMLFLPPIEVILWI